MLKNNKNLIINILIFIIFLFLFKNLNNLENMTNDDKDYRGCSIDLGKDNSIKTINQRVIKYGDLNVIIDGVKYECEKDCDCPTGSRCQGNKCTREGTFACIDANTGDCREFDLNSYGNSDWKAPLTEDFNGFKTFCNFIINDPNNLDVKFESLAINGGCPKNNMTIPKMEKIKNLLDNLR